MSWYVLKARQELKVRDALIDRGIFAYVPCERIKVRRGRNKVVEARPVWRGYVFVMEDDEGRWLSASSIDGAHDFIRYQCGPAMIPLPMSLLALDPIIAAEAAGDLDYAAKASYEPQRGDRVHVKSGKWKGYLARVLSVAKRKVLLEPDIGFGRLEVEHKHLEAAA